MTEQRTPATTAPDTETTPRLDARRVLGAGAALAAVGAVLVLVSAWHLTQGTSGLGVGDILRMLVGDDVSGEVRDIVVGSRLPRLAAGLAVGFALGVAGALLQSVSRNALAAPDTLGVTAGAYLAVTAVAAFGLAVPLWASGLTAFLGGLAAAGLVLALAGGAGTSTSRLVLAGSAVALALQSGTASLLILFEEETTGLYAWGNGSLSQLGLQAFWRAAPVVVVVTALALLLARRLDLLGLGDDGATALGVPVRSTRAAGVVLSVLLTATAVTLAGPIGFVGLLAPAAVRLAAHLVPAFHRHVVLLPAAGLLGALVVVLSDALLRAAVGPATAIAIPTGVTTSLLGALVLVVLARRLRDAGPVRRPAAARAPSRSRRRFVVVLLVAGVAVVGVVVAGLLLGFTVLRTGDVVLWVQGDAPAFVSFALDERTPRLAAAVVAGGGLALAGLLVQATCRNPLAEPGLLGITGGAGLGAVVVVLFFGDAGQGVTLTAAVVGGLASFVAVYLLSWRGGLQSDRLVLVGIGMWTGTTALTTFLLLRASPFDTPRIYTFLSGTTYGRTWGQVLPVLVVLLLVIPLAVAVRREIDLLAVDEDTPRLAGVSLERTRLLVLGASAVLAATCVVAVGVVGFVGLVAPHAARALVGGRTSRALPVTILVGMVLMGAADTIGRTVIAPAQVPAGLVVALIGAPYFVYLLARTRA